MKYCWLAAVLFLIFSNCSCGRYISLNKVKTNKEYNIFAEDKIKSGYDLIYNSDSTFVLCQKVYQNAPLHPQRTIDFIIYDINKDKNIYESNIPDGSIGWLNKYIVKIVYRHEMASKGNNDANFQTEYYDVKKNAAVPVSPDIKIPGQN